MKVKRRILCLLLTILFLSACSSPKNQVTKNSNQSEEIAEAIDYSTFSDAKREFITRLVALNELDENGVSGRLVTYRSNGEIVGSNRIIFDSYKDYGYIEKISWISESNEPYYKEFYRKNERYIVDYETDNWIKVVDYPKHIEYYNTDWHGNGIYFINPSAIAYFESAADDQFSLEEDGSPYFYPKYDSDLLFTNTPEMHEYIVSKKNILIIDGKLKNKDIYKEKRKLLQKNSEDLPYAYFDEDDFVGVIGNSSVTLIRTPDEVVPDLPAFIYEVEAKDYHSDFSFMTEE